MPGPPGDWRDCGLAVTGLSAADNPAPGVAVARSLREAGHRGPMVGLAYDTMDTGLYHSEIFDEIYMVPFPGSGGELLLERLRAVAEAGRLDAVLPTLDSEMELYLSLKSELESGGTRTFLPDAGSLALRSKMRLDRFCREHEFDAPPTRVVFERAAASLAWEELWASSNGRPVYVKGLYYEARKAWTLEQALYAFDDIHVRWGLPIVLHARQHGLD